jgi:hypothetical protein
MESREDCLHEASECDRLAQLANTQGTRALPEKFQRCELLRLARAVGRQDFEVLFDCRHDASRCTWAGLGVETIRISRQVKEVLACSLPWVIRPRVGIAEGVEPFIGTDQFLDLGACVGLTKRMAISQMTL